MDGVQPDYDPRYLAGILLFNRGDFFEAHEVWEDVWTEATGDAHRFYQGLIQAAVGLLHFGNGNLRGAIKLYHSSRDYMRELKIFLGLDVVDFWAQMDKCYASLLANPEQSPSTSLSEDLLPTIQLNPPPDAWPDVEHFVDNAD